jgi:phosphatidate cytidylyltransferase
MLRQRILTALVLAPLAVAAILWLPTAWFAVAIGLVFLVGALELARLCNLHDRESQRVFVVAVAGVMAAAWWLLAPGPIWGLSWLLSAWWAIVSIVMLVRRRPLDRVDTRRWGILLIGTAVLVGAWLSLVMLHARDGSGPVLVLFLFVLIWVADSCAYFAGRAFGRHKLSPVVSPGKTWEGAVGATLGATGSAVVLFALGLVDAVPAIVVVALCVVVTWASIGGDLWESRLKREAGVKDSGDVLPGHGGVLDRFDSLLAAAPVFVAGAWTIGMLG